MQQSPVGDVFERIQMIQGEKGEKGDQGEQGIQGIPGTDGKDGIQGIPGDRGERGPTGRAGQNGTDGKDGVNGINGKDGVNGISPDIQTVVDSVLSIITSGKLKVEHINGLTDSLSKLKEFLKIGGYRGGGDTITAGSNVTITTVNGIKQISASASGGSGFQQSTSGVVNGSNQIFIWATAPNVIVVDQGRPMQKVSSDGTVNWTGTTTTTLSIAPTFDIFATA
jgi:hypothetical protein